MEFFLSIFSLSPMEQASFLIRIDTVNDYPVEYSIQPALQLSTVSKKWLMTCGIFPATWLSLYVGCSSSEGFLWLLYLLFSAKKLHLNVSLVLTLFALSMRFILCVHRTGHSPFVAVNNVHSQLQSLLLRPLMQMWVSVIPLVIGLYSLHSSAVNPHRSRWSIHHEDVADHLYERVNIKKDIVGPGCDSMSSKGDAVLSICFLSSLLLSCIWQWWSMCIYWGFWGYRWYGT